MMKRHLKESGKEITEYGHRIGLKILKNSLLTSTQTYEPNPEEHEKNMGVFQ